MTIGSSSLNNKLKLVESNTHGCNHYSRGTQLAAHGPNPDLLGVVARPQTPRGEIYRSFKYYEAHGYGFLQLHFLNFRSPHLITFEKEKKKKKKVTFFCILHYYSYKVLIQTVISLFSEMNHAILLNNNLYKNSY